MCSGRPFHITIAKFGKVDVELPEQQQVYEVASTLIEAFFVKKSVTSKSLTQMPLEVTAQ